MGVRHGLLGWAGLPRPSASPSALLTTSVGDLYQRINSQRGKLLPEEQVGCWYLPTIATVCAVMCSYLTSRS